MLEKKSVFTVATYDCDSIGRLQPHSLMHHLQEIASRHAEDLGVGRRWMEKNGYYWVLVNFRLDLETMPRYGETVILKTWPSGLDLLRAYRDFKGEDLEGNVLFRATSDWMVIDSKNLHPVMTKDMDFDFEHSSTRIIRNPDRLKPSGDYMDSVMISVPYSSIDMNGHVNNTEYVKWGSDAIRNSTGEDPDIQYLQITFLAEVFKGEELVLQTRESSPGIFRARGRRNSDGKDAFVIEISLN